MVQDCETAYREAPDRLRRQFNQACFKRILIDDEYTVTGELAEPFETLLSEELRQAAARKAEDDLSRAVEEVSCCRYLMGFIAGSKPPYCVPPVLLARRFSRSVKPPSRPCHALPVSRVAVPASGSLAVAAAFPQNR